jgi:hypothetical protein
VLTRLAQQAFPVARAIAAEGVQIRSIVQAVSHAEELPQRDARS